MRRCFDRVMPRVRPTAGRWLALAVVSASICFSPGFVSGAPRAVRPGRAAETDARRRDEIDSIQRQDAAEALKKHFNIDVDWRTTPLDRLVDIRVRAAKAAELQQRLGVSVDWQRYTWIELEALRRTLISFEVYRDQQGGPIAAAPPRPGAPPLAAPPSRPLGPLGNDGLVPPTFKGGAPARPGRSADPDGILRPTFTGRAGASAVASDPDGVIRPTFASRPRWSAFGGDPDGLIAPTFTTNRRLSSIGDADDLIDPTRTQKGRAVPTRW
jgi:hypothetical protein